MKKIKILGIGAVLSVCTDVHSMETFSNKMTLIKKIIFGMGVTILANAPMVGASDLPEVKDGQTKLALMERIREISGPIIEKIDQYSPKYSESAHIITAFNTFPLFIGCYITSNFWKYGIGPLTTIVPLCNTYFLYKSDKKMETLCPSKSKYGVIEPYSKMNKFCHLLLGGSIVVSNLATIFTKNPAFLCYTILAAGWQSVNLKHSVLTMKFVKEGLENKELEETLMQ